MVTTNAGQRSDDSIEIEGGGEQESLGAERSQSSERAVRSWLERVGPSLVSAACVVAAWAVLLPKWFHFQQDDVWEFSLAHSEGLSWKFLAVNGFEHFGPITRFNHWAEWAISPYSVGVGIAMTVVFFALLLLSVVWLIDELDVPLRRRIPLVVIGGLAMPLLSVAAWNDAAVYIIPTLAATYAVMASHAHALRTGRLRFHLLTCGFMLIAVGLQERGGIAVALIVLMDVFVLGRGEAWRDRFRRLWRIRWPLLALVAIAATDGIIWRLFYVWPGQRQTDAVTGAKVVADAFGQYLLPSFIARHVPLQGGVLLLVAVIVVTGIALLAWRDRRNLDLVIFFCLTFLLYYIGLWFGPLLVNGVQDNANQPKYLAYVVFPLLIVVSLFGTSNAASGEVLTVRSGRGTHRRVMRRWPSWVAVVVVSIGIGAFLLAQDVHTLDQDFWYARSLDSFYSNVRSQEAAWSSTTTALLPLQVPPYVVGSWAAPWGQEEDYLRVVDPSLHVAPGVGSFSMVDEEGKFQSVSAKITAVIPTDGLTQAVSGSALVQNSSPATCATLGPIQRWLRFAVPPQQTRGRFFVALSYAATGTAAVQITAVSAAGAGDNNVWPETLTAGRHLAVFPLDGRSFSDVQFSGLSGHTHVCVNGVAVIQPVLPVGHGICSVVTVYGGAGPDTDCDQMVENTAQLSRVMQAPTRVG
jgi:hypothetical protein